MDTPFEGVVFLTSERVAQLMSECETKELELGAVFAFLARLTLWLPEAATPDAGGVFMSPDSFTAVPDWFLVECPDFHNDGAIVVIENEDQEMGHLTLLTLIHEGIHRRRWREGHFDNYNLWVHFREEVIAYYGMIDPKCMKMKLTMSAVALAGAVGSVVGGLSMWARSQREKGLL